jgi:hypothetical protein
VDPGGRERLSEGSELGAELRGVVVGLEHDPPQGGDIAGEVDALLAAELLRDRSGAEGGVGVVRRAPQRAGDRAGASSDRGVPLAGRGEATGDAGGEVGHRALVEDLAERGDGTVVHVLPAQSRHRDDDDAAIGRWRRRARRRRCGPDDGDHQRQAGEEDEQRRAADGHGEVAPGAGASAGNARIIR